MGRKQNEMGNMSYVRFENTVKDLHDCYNHLFDDLGESEERARKELYHLCATIALELEDLYEADNT